MMRRLLIALLVQLHPCGRNTSIAATGMALPGDCSFCEHILEVLYGPTLTAVTADE